MTIRVRRRDPTARCALEKAILYEEGFVHLLNGASVLADRRRYRAKSHGSAIEFLNDRAQQATIHVVESEMIDIEECQGGLCHRQRDPSISADLRVVAHASQQTDGDARRTPGSFGDFMRPRRIYLHP